MQNEGSRCWLAFGMYYYYSTTITTNMGVDPQNSLHSLFFPPLPLEIGL